MRSWRAYLREVAKTHARVETSKERMIALLDLAEAVDRWQAARDYGDSDAAAAEVAAAYAKLEAIT